MINLKLNATTAQKNNLGETFDDILRHLVRGRLRDFIVAVCRFDVRFNLALQKAAHYSLDYRNRPTSFIARANSKDCGDEIRRYLVGLYGVSESDADAVCRAVSV